MLGAYTIFDKHILIFSTEVIKKNSGSEVVKSRHI